MGDRELLNQICQSPFQAAAEEKKGFQAATGVGMISEGWQSAEGRGPRRRGCHVGFLASPPPWEEAESSAAWIYYLGPPRMKERFIAGSQRDFLGGCGAAEDEWR